MRDFFIESFKSIICYNSTIYIVKKFDIMKRLILVDTFGFLFRSHFALPPLRSHHGKPIGVLMGFANLIMQLHKDYKNEYLIFALDSKEENLRKGLDPNYKATRPEAPQELLEQIPIVIDWMNKMNLCSCSVAGYEADDVIATLTKRAKEKNMNILIMSHDKDMFQLVEEHVNLYHPISKKILGAEECYQKYGVNPSEFIDFQSIVGDTADNVPGVKGIGLKGAAQLIKDFKTIEGIYEHIEELPSRIQALLLASKENAFLSKQLVTLNQDVPLTFEFKQSIVPEKNPLLHIIDDLEEFDFNRILKKLTKDFVSVNLHTEPIQSKTQKNHGFFERNAEMITDEKYLFSLLETLKPDSIVAFDTETTSLDARNAQVVGFSFALNAQKGYYVPLNHSYLGVQKQLSMDVAKRAIQKISQSLIVGHNIKYDLEVISCNFDIFVDMEHIIDTMVLAWLLDCSQSLGLDFLAKKYFAHNMIAFNDVVKKKSTFSEVFLEEATQYAAEDAQATYFLYENLIDEIYNTQQSHLVDIAKELEFPFIRVIQVLEENGIKIDIDFFEHFKKEISERIATITDEIYHHADCSFNINSPLQLGEILFERLKLPCKKKTKSGYSTDENVLLGLRDSHPIIPFLIEYREIFKLRTTYIEPLLRLAKSKDSCRVHTSFLQTGTTTGRLSSRNPNLQNIPVRTDLGRRIRKGFVAEDGYVLLSLDYSQIELRLLAHFSQDKAMIDAFCKNADIHYETAKHIFTEEYAKEKRQIAKSINFGLIYGMGAKKLSETLNISYKDSRQYIENYFDSFPTVKSYLKNTEDLILEQGYTETLLKRRRTFNFQQAAPYQKAAFLREGINTIFQGSAADLIKMAMLEIYRLFKTKNDIRMLLQIHDELIFEVKEQFAQEYAKSISAIMEGIYPLRVPLVCGIGIGKNWGDLK